MLPLDTLIPELSQGQGTLITPWQLRSHHGLRHIFLMVSGVSPFPHVPKPSHCSPLSPFVKRLLAAPSFSPMTSGLPH